VPVQLWHNLGHVNASYEMFQAMALQELEHPYICGYKEFFVNWDPAEAAMFVCIVMEYYKNGDLENVLKQRRTKKQPIEELVSKSLRSYLNKFIFYCLILVGLSGPKLWLGTHDPRL